MSDQYLTFLIHNLNPKDIAYPDYITEAKCKDTGDIQEENYSKDIKRILYKI